MEATDLASLLRIAESHGAPMSGEVDYVSFQRREGTLGRDKNGDKKYRYTRTEGQWAVEVENHEEDADNTEYVRCRNPKYAFSVARRNAKWLVLRIEEVSALQGKEDNDIRSFLRHFRTCCDVGETSLADILASREHMVTIETCGVRQRRICGARRQGSLHPVLRCMATVQVADNGRYAYVIESRADIENAKWIWDSTVVNEVKEEPEHPELRASKEVLHFGKPGERIELELHRAYRSLGPTHEDHTMRYCLSHYGFGEPDIDRPQLVSGKSRFSWFFGLLVAGVALLAVGRSLGSTVASASS
jgi:hypothetical protein